MGRSIEEDVDDYLESRTEDELRDLLADLATTNPQVRQTLHRRASAARTQGSEASRGLIREVRSVLASAWVRRLLPGVPTMPGEIEEISAPHRVHGRDTRRARRRPRARCDSS
ncbi:MAG: hypothetical protein LKI24_15345 [Acidipropionibacterium sp.]|jgi:hypothetical protein|nr:hypothetical protein [Acidipropionibacterium sp.]